MLANCTSERYAVNKSRMLRLADYSRVWLAALRNETRIKYDERMRGTLQLFRTQAQLEASGKDVKALAADGIPYEVLDRDGCIRAEPALAHVRDKIIGGLLTPKDETGTASSLLMRLPRGQNSVAFDSPGARKSKSLMSRAVRCGVS